MQQQTLLLIFVFIFRAQGFGIYDVPEYREYAEKWQKAMSEFRNNKDFVKAMNEFQAKDEYPWDDVTDIPFECQVDENAQPTATSVHRLKPTDVSVIGALGDSITAGNGLGARILPEVIFENRGESWSVGGDSSLEHGRVTLANVFKKFNPNLRGYSICKRRINHEMASLNVAVPGATCRNMPAQADDLIDKMWNNQQVDWWNDWKVVTILIGGNDLCAVCRRESDYNPDAYRDRIREALDKLHLRVPRALVNVVVMLDVNAVRNITDFKPWCGYFQNQFCSCALTDPEYLREVQLGYYDKLKELIDSRRYDTRDDFTVVLQPHMRDQYPLIDEETGKYDYDYFAPDCFHPSRKGHQEMAFILWNVMMIPEHEKPFTSDPEDHPTYMCPTKEHPYIFTHKNTYWNEMPISTTTEHVNAAASTLMGLSTSLLPLGLVLLAVLRV